MTLFIAILMLAASMADVILNDLIPLYHNTYHPLAPREKKFFNRPWFMVVMILALGVSGYFFPLSGMQLNIMAVVVTLFLVFMMTVSWVCFITYYRRTGKTKGLSMPVSTTVISFAFLLSLWLMAYKKF